ncbi:CASP-like protein PIMP1 [Andrographis paniculata]|uniref:CASP-like protein PIMP1 n=1 Tax=Andrographis paniculata TaxID=175694 RepID=UPI0021E6F436|nr:CASP-like protein PIMP1 [Andrographis paniculata]
MAPPPAPATTQVVSPVTSLVVRILTIICLFVSLVVLFTASGYASNRYYYVKVTFKNVNAFRYLCSALVIGLVYTLAQTGLAVYQIITGSNFGGDTLIYFEFYGDKALSYLLATGGAAGLGMTQDVEGITDRLGLDRFINKANASIALCLLGFAFSILSSIFSSFNLPKMSVKVPSSV